MIRFALDSADAIVEISVKKTVFYKTASSRKRTLDISCTPPDTMLFTILWTLRFVCPSWRPQYTWWQLGTTAFCDNSLRVYCIQNKSWFEFIRRIARTKFCLSNKNSLRCTRKIVAATVPATYCPVFIGLKELTERENKSKNTTSPVGSVRLVCSQ